MNRPALELATPEESISIWLTREEWLLCHAYQWVALVYPAYGADRMTNAERTETFVESFARALSWAIRELHSLGFRFQAIDVERHGKIVPTRDEPIEPRNRYFLWKMSQGSMVSPITAIETALEQLDRQGILIDRGPMLECLSQVRSDVRAAEEALDADPETAAIVKEEVQAQLPRALEILRKVVPPGDEVN